MKNILFDLSVTQPIKSVKFHGGGEYGQNIFKTLLRQNLSDVNLIVTLYENKFISQEIVAYLNKYKVKIIFIESFSDVIKALSIEKIDVLYMCLAPYEMIKYKLPDHTKFIVTLHGLRNMEAPYSLDELKYNINISIFIRYLFKIILKKYYYYLNKIRYQKLIEMASIVFVDSYHTKYSILSHISMKYNEKIEVRYPLIENKEQNTCNYRDFFLIVSSKAWIKNSMVALQVLDDLYTEKKINRITIVLGANKQIRRSVKNKRFFVFFDYVSRDELEAFYCQCFCLIYPTLNEGFGLPPLEVMKYGKISIVSANSSLMEILKDNTIYHETNNKYELKSRIMQVISEKIDKEKLIAAFHKIKEKSEFDTRDIVNKILE